MKRTALGLSLFVGLGLVAAISGCANLIPPQAVNFDLNGGAGLEFAVTPGEPVQRMATLSFNPAGVNITGGTFEIKPEAITLNAEEAQPGKIATRLQGGVVTVSGRVAIPGQEDDVCNSTDVYGAYDVTFDNNLAVTDINPSSITLSTNTITVLNADPDPTTGLISVAICLDVSAPFTGTVTIRALTFNINITLQ